MAAVMRSMLWATEKLCDSIEEFVPFTVRKQNYVAVCGLWKYNMRPRGFDSVVSSTEKLSHPTTSRPKATGRRPPSQSLTSSSLSSPDIFDSPSPEEDKEEHISLVHRGVDVSKKTSKTVTISQVSDNKASLPPKPGTMAAGGGGPASLSSVASSPLSSSLGTAGHRANSPSLFSTEGKPKMEPVASSQAAVEELRTQVRKLRSIIETMKDQQK
ncbi:SH3 domain-containing kinase-binding protein 1-like [Ictidomys tridecemlineatus]